MNNADLGITIQKFICDYFNLPIPMGKRKYIFYQRKY